MADGIKKSDLIEGNAIDDIRLDLDEMAVSLEKTDKQFKSIAKTLKSDINPTLDKTSKGIREINEAEIKSEKLLREKLVNEEKLKKVKIAQERLTQAELRTKVAQNKEAARQAKLTRDEIILNDKNAGTLEKLAAKNRLLSKERQKLNLETEKGRKRLRAINSEIDRNNKVIEKNSDKLKQQRLGIGRYQKALGGLRRALTTIGVTFGVAQLFRDVTGVLIDFNQAQADLASILADATIPQLKALEDQAKDLGATTTFTASQVSELQKELAKLGFDPKQIEDMTEGVLLLAEATGTELAEAAKVSGAVINAFGLEAKDSQQVVDVMTKSFSSSSLDMQKFSVAMASVAPVAKTMNFSLEETTSMLGILTDSGLDASTAGTSLRNMILEANKAGLTWNEALDKVNNSQDKAGTSLELFGKRGVAAGVILAENQEKVAGLTEKLNDADGAAEKMADTQRNTLGGSLKLLRSAWEGYILDLNESTGATNGLRSAVKFLADNLGTILSTGWELIKFFAIYKTRIIVLNALNGKFGASLKNVAAAFKEGFKNGKLFSGALKSIGSLLKSGLGITAIIAGAVKLAQAFYDVASGARQARQDLELLNALTGKVNAKIQEGVDLRKKELDQKLELAETEKERKQLKEDFIKQNDREAASLQKTLDKNKGLLDIAKRMQAQQTGFQETTSEFADQFVNFFGQDVRDINDIVGEYEAKVAALEGGITILNVSTQDAKHELEVFNKEVRSGTASSGKNAEAVEEQTKAYKDLSDEIDNILNQGRFVFEIEDEEITQENEKIRKILQQQLTAINDAERNKTLTVEQAAEQRIIVELEALNKRKEILELYGRDVIDINKEISDKRLELTKLGAEEEVEVETDKNEEIFNAYRNLQEALTDVLTTQIDERIALLGKEADAAKSQQDFFEALAAQGNITAQQSIAEQIEIQREAEAEQARLAKVKQRVQAISAGLQTYTSLLDEGKSPTEALAGTLTTTEVLAQLLSNINFFEKGTDNAPQGWAVVDEKGSEIITDKKGNIKDLGQDGGARWKYLDAGDKVMTANKSANLLNRFDQIGMNEIVNNAQDNAGNSYDLMILNETMKNMSNKMDKMQTKFEVDWQGLAGGMARVNVTKTKGGDKRTERYTIR